jgi:hypothetical protein
LQLVKIQSFNGLILSMRHTQPQLPPMETNELNKANKNLAVLSEDVITIPQACDWIKATTGRKTDRTTVYRWVLNGVEGQKLEAVRVGRQILTSRQALTRFIAARSI